jgi:preprotein translocase subunit SecE
MATEVAPRVSTANRLSGFFRDVVAEMHKVTWPEKTQVRQLSIYVVAFSLIVGLVILIMDLVLQGLLMRFIPSLFGRG